MTGQFHWRSALAGWILFPALLAAVVPARADRLDDELLRAGPRVMEYLRSKHYTTVAVLPFHVQRGEAGGKLEDTPLETNLADRLERSLILAIDPEHPVAVVAQARAAVAKQWGSVLHETSVERAKLFGVKYPLPIHVKDRMVRVEVFLTGTVVISDDHRTTKVIIQAFDKDRAEGYDPVLTIAVPTGRSILADSAEGFSLSKQWAHLSRGAPGEVAREIQQLDDRAASSGLAASDDFPVELQIQYNDQTQSLKHDDYVGPYNLIVPTPQEGQRVMFILQNRSDEKLGVVLTINGMNTLYKESGLEATQMSYWTLEPHKKYSVSGFYHADGKTLSAISALSESESRTLAGKLGAKRAGLVELHVLRGSPLGVTLPTGLMAARGSTTNLRNAVVPYRQDPAPPQSWDDLRQQIAVQAAGVKPRGLMAPSVNATGDLAHEEFSCPFHTDTLVVRYWTGDEGPSKK